MGHIFDFQDVQAYQEWCAQPDIRATIDLEEQLMRDLLEPMRGRSILDVGCGLGIDLQFFLQFGLSVTGLDPSPYMLDAAAAVLGNRADLHRGVAENLPFDDNAFHYVCLVKTLEYVDDPQKAISEACRVAKDRVFIGITSRRSLKKMRKQCRQLPLDHLISDARFLSVWEIKKIVHQLLGDVPITWRSIRNTSISSGRFAHFLAQSGFIRKCPFGDYIGLVITPIPRIKTRPLGLPCTVRPKPGGAVG